MNHTTIRPQDVLLTVKAHPWRVIVPVTVLTVLAAVFSLVRPATWEASQALVVRNEAGDRVTRPGKFTHADEMKTTQETILELARSRSVLTKALQEVGPPADRTSTAAWPTDLELEALQGNVKVSPPKGAEFGKTEVFYLKVQDSSQQRAIALASAVCGQLQNRFAELREAKAQSTTDELTKSASLAQQDLAEATTALSQIEQSVGSDLAELRILNDSPSGDSDLRRTATDLEKELRASRAAQNESEEFLKLLTAAQSDPAKLLASPPSLLKSQPALGRLKDGLVDAQLRTGQALGTMSAEHPLTKAARAAEQAIRDQLHDEISLALRGIESDLRVNAVRVRDLERQNTEIQARLNRLATVRAEYANLATSAKSRGEALKAVENDLAEARASQSAARSASLINLIDSPDAGPRPIGPGRSMITLAGMMGGFLVAAAIVFLSVKPTSTSPREIAAVPGEVPATVTFPVVRESARFSQVSGPLNLKQALQRVAEGRI